jgi:hypothetical protein
VTDQGEGEEFAVLETSAPKRIIAVPCPAHAPRDVSDNCPACLGRGWQWSDGVPPVVCTHTLAPPRRLPLPCGRGGSTCPGCGRTPLEVAEIAKTRASR